MWWAQHVFLQKRMRRKVCFIGHLTSLPRRLFDLGQTYFPDRFKPGVIIWIYLRNIEPIFSISQAIGLSCFRGIKDERVTWIDFPVCLYKLAVFNIFELLRFEHLLALFKWMMNVQIDIELCLVEFPDYVLCFEVLVMATEVCLSSRRLGNAHFIILTKAAYFPSVMIKRFQFFVRGTIHPYTLLKL